MAAIEWDAVGARYYETGLDRAVLYTPGETGVPWNGLTAIDEEPSSTAEAIHYDGVKFNDIITVGDFAATMRAYTYPDEFLYFEGIVEGDTGVYFADQPPTRFHLSYRTGIGNDLDPELGYKIHLLYNVTAIPTQKSYSTMGLDTTPSEFSWRLTAIPEEVYGYKPTAHLILDSRKIDESLLADLEVIFYGDDISDPKLPPMQSLVTFIQRWERLMITDNGDGTWSASTIEPGIIEMLDADTFQLNNVNGVYLDADTYEIQSSDKNEEELL